MKEESQKIISKIRKDGINAKESSKDENKNSLNDTMDSKRKNQRIERKIIKNAESQKLKLRNKLVVAIKHIIWFQLVFFNIVVLLIVASVTMKAPIFKDIDTELAIQLFDFLKYYISATIVELLGMLVFILHYVFSPHKKMKLLKTETQSN